LSPEPEGVRVFGIRHHGPGSARALGRALKDYKPDLVLIEGPPEADPILELAADADMVPPVALLAYLPADGDESRRAAFWPFAEFSPEWQAIRHAHTEAIPVRFCDLPAAHTLAPQPPDVAGEGPTGEGPTGEGPTGEAPAGEGPSGEGPMSEAPAGEGPSGEGPMGEGPGAGDRAAEDQAEAVRTDPLGTLASAAGYDDAERWWDDVIEHREGESPFEAIAEAMGALREGMEQAHTEREEQREAYMRQTLRKAIREGHERIAVVCGAWHVPAILAKVAVSRDVQTLKGLPKAKVAMTWVPWTHGRLANASGYGAGVRSPGWYHHLFTATDRPIERWLTETARVLREEDLPVSSAHVIEAVRLAETLAVLRGRPLAGLDEVTEATLAVLCEGAELPVELIQRRMVVGERLGTVPDRTPMVPLQRDLISEQRRLRFKPAALDKEEQFDLRKPNELDRSRLLHRLRILDVPWGEPARSGRTKGTFKETWTLAWRPEFDIQLIEAGFWGTTVKSAAGAKVEALAATAETLPDLTALAERCLLADLGDALPAVMRTLADRAAADTDVAHLMGAVPSLVRSLRYGDVRGTPVGPLRTVVDGLVVRICVGLPPAVTGLDDDAAKALLKQIDAMNEALALLDEPDHVKRWHDTLLSLIDRTSLHGLLEGRLSRLLRDVGRVEDLPDRMARAVSVGQPPARAAAWIEGFLSGGGLVLVHDEALLRLVDGWVGGLSAESFTDVLPLLRRSFSAFEAPERRSIGAKVRHLDETALKIADDETDLDLDRAAPAVATVLSILGLSPEASE
jgi:hypothetical protein